MEPAVCDHIGCTPGLVCKENATNARRMDDASTPQSTSGPTPQSSPGGMVQAIDFRNIHWDSNHHPWTPDHPRGVAIVVRIPAHIPGQITPASFVNGLGIPLHVQTEDANVDQHGRADRVWYLARGTPFTYVFVNSLGGVEWMQHRGGGWAGTGR